MKTNVTYLFKIAFLFLVGLNGFHGIRIEIRKADPNIVAQEARNIQTASSWEQTSQDPKFLPQLMQLHYLCSSVLRSAFSRNMRNQKGMSYLQDWVRRDVIGKTSPNRIEILQTVMNNLCRKLYSHPQARDIRDRNPINYSSKSSTTHVDKHDALRHATDFEEQLRKLENDLKSGQKIPLGNKKILQALNDTKSEGKSNNSTKTDSKIGSEGIDRSDGNLKLTQIPKMETNTEVKKEEMLHTQQEEVSQGNTKTKEKNEPKIKTPPEPENRYSADNSSKQSGIKPEILGQNDKQEDIVDQTTERKGDSETEPNMFLSPEINEADSDKLEYQ